MRKGFASNYRLVIILVAVGLCFIGIGARLVFLHVINREEVLRRVAKAREDMIIQHARRGDIRDVTGKVLATSKVEIELGVDPQALVAKDEGKWPQLAELLGMPLSKLQIAFRTKTRSINAPAAKPKVDDKGVPHFSFGEDDGASPLLSQQEDKSKEEEVNAKGERLIRWARLTQQVGGEEHDAIDVSLYEKIMKLEIKGVYGVPLYRRVYPQDGLAAHVIGYVNAMGEPCTGIERFADFYLRGQNGWIASEKDAGRRELPQFRTQEVAAVNGYDVVLSIDSVVQHIVEEEVDALVAKFKPKKVTIIVSDPRTGFLLAMANYPSFNLNEYSKADIAALKNVAVTDVIEPGSTFKIVASSGALNEGLVSEGSKFDCTLTSTTNRGYTVGLPKEDHHFDHPLTLREILSHSSNKGAAQLAILMGEQKFYDYARLYNFGQKTGFPTDSESRGSLRNPKTWYPIDITRMAMGHSVSATPLQVHCAMQTIAAGGRWMRPQVIKEIRDGNGEMIFHFEPIAERTVIRPETAERMAAMMKWVTVKNEGTAVEANIEGFEVAGKTGTTEKLVDGHYVNNKHVASFVGFFPASRPALVISVIVDEATQNLIRNTAYGAHVAAPSFKHIGEQLVPYLNIRPVVELRRPVPLAMGTLP